MKKSFIQFLQIVIVLIAICALVIMIRFPLTEGRAANLDLFSIYADPFILLGYLASIPFYIALYQAFMLLEYIGRNKTFSLNSVKAVRNIKYCAIVLGILIVMAGIYIRISYALSPATHDDPAGFLALCIVSTFISIVIATTAALFEKRLKKGVNGNDLK